MFPTPLKFIFENTMGNSFIDFLNIDRNTSKKNRIEIWTFSFQIYFWNQFWTLGPKLILKADLKRECPYFYSKFFFEAFRSIF